MSQPRESWWRGMSSRPTVTIATALFRSFWLVRLIPGSRYHQRTMRGWKRVGKLLCPGYCPDASEAGAES